MKKILLMILFSIIAALEARSQFVNPTAIQSDTLPWQITQDSTGKWRIFSAAYHDSSGTILHFSKWNQPTSITLHTYVGIFDSTKAFRCHWDSSINYPVDRGLLWMDDYDIFNAYLHIDTEAYSYSMPGVAYPVPTLPFNADDSTGHYEYHTFAMEWLPNEVRYLVDSVVVRRFPDRMVPPSSPYYDWAGTMPRVIGADLRIETDFDYDENDPLGKTPGTITYQERQYFEHAASVMPRWPGFKNVTIGGHTYNAAHHKLDYVKIWDVPSNVKIPDYPH